MKFFIDTANIEEIKKAHAMGMVDGVTTNPSLIARENRPFEELLLAICELVDGPVNGEVVSLDAEGMVTEGRKLAAMHPNIVVKVPMTTEGLKAVKVLSSENIRTNVTLAFSPTQALDISQAGMELVSDIMHIYGNYGYETEVIVASIRNPMHVVESALIGADIATIPFKVIDQLAKHPLTDIGMEKFLADWEKRTK
jgi:transaldolase